MEEINGRYKISIPCPDGDMGCGVCHYAHIKVDAFNQIHDRYYDEYGKAPSETVVALIFPLIPMEIKGLASQWGWDDTEVREKVAEWFNGKIIISL